MKVREVEGVDLTRLGCLLGKSSARQVFSIAALGHMDTVFPKPVSVLVGSEKGDIVQIIFFDRLTRRGLNW